MTATTPSADIDLEFGQEARVCELQEVAHIQSGLAKGRSGPEATLELPYIRTANVQAGWLDLAEMKTLFVTPQQSIKHRLEHEDVLILEGGDADKVGRGWIWESQVPDCLHQNHVFAVRTDPEVLSPRYLAYYVNSPAARRYFLACAKQTTNLASINRRQLSALPVPLPSLEAQLTAVSAVERYLSRVDEGVRNFETALKAAEMMRLVLLERCWDGSRVETLEELLDAPFKNGRSVPTAEEGFPVLRLTALREGVVNTGEAKVGAWSGEEARPFLIEEHDFLVARGNGSLKLVGRGGLVVNEPPPVAFPDTLIRVRVDSSRLLGEFLRFAWDSQRVRAQIEERAHTSAGIYKVNQEMLRDIQLPVPSLREQRRLVEEIKTQTESLQRLEVSLRQQLGRAGALRSAVLHAAFSGSLTAGVALAQNETDAVRS